MWTRVGLNLPRSTSLCPQSFGIKGMRWRTQLLSHGSQAPVNIAGFAFKLVQYGHDLQSLSALHCPSHHLPLEPLHRHYLIDDSCSFLPPYPILQHHFLFFFLEKTPPFLPSPPLSLLPSSSSSTAGDQIQGHPQTGQTPHCYALPRVSACS